MLRGFVENALVFLGLLLLTGVPFVSSVLFDHVREQDLPVHLKVCDMARGSHIACLKA